jgi:hypothetical protein
MFHGRSVKWIPHDGGLLFEKDSCPLKDENSFVSDLQEIANSEARK